MNRNKQNDGGTFEKNVKTGLLIPISGGLAAGIVNGYLGSGGGIILMFVYMYLAGRNGADGKDCFASTVISVLPMTVVSAIVYNLTGNAALNDIAGFIAPAIIGGLIGGILTEKIKTNILKFVFALIMIWSGINMFMK